MLLLGVVLEQVVGDEFYWVLRSLFGTFAQGLEDDRHHGLVKIGPYREVVKVFHALFV